MGRGQPGQVLPAQLQTALKLTDEQKKKVEELQKDVDTKLAAILTDEQKKLFVGENAKRLFTRIS